MSNLVLFLSVGLGLIFAVAAILEATTTSKEMSPPPVWLWFVLDPFWWYVGARIFLFVAGAAILLLSHAI